MATDVAQFSPPSKVIAELIAEAREADQQERRQTVRYPFFRPVTVRTDMFRKHSAFTREISTDGIGLLHRVEFRLGKVDVLVPNSGGTTARLRVHILWCKPCGEGWYISGGRFI
ncbi:MAG: PilZ domain-containing protein [Pirellulales bacterium]